MYKWTSLHPENGSAGRERLVIGSEPLGTHTPFGHSPSSNAAKGSSPVPKAAERRRRPDASVNTPVADVAYTPHMPAGWSVS